MTHADVLTDLRSLAPSGPPSWTPQPDGGEGDPLQAAFEAEADALYRYVSALSGRDAWLAEELVVRVFVGVAEGDAKDRTPEALFMQARHATLAILAKADDDAQRPVAPAELALVLERRAGLALEALARTWGTRPAALEARLIDAARHHTTGDEACSDWKDPTVRASVDLLPEEQAETWAEHLMDCEACAAWSESLEAQLALKEGLPSRERTWERVQAELTRHTRDLGIRVGVRCTYCHAGLPQEEASFCAACLAAHHAECFSEHGTCAAPACGGTQLVYPRRAPARGRSARWPWVMGGLLVGAAALSPVAYGPVTRALNPGASDGGGAIRQSDATAQSTAANELPLDSLSAGCRVDEVVHALGTPSAVYQLAPSGEWVTRPEAHPLPFSQRWYETAPGRRPPETRLALTYRELGARVEFNERGQLSLASFYGSAGESPELALWAYRGIVWGSKVSAGFLADSVDLPRRDTLGNVWLKPEPGVVARLTPDNTLAAIHLANGYSADKSGVFTPSRFELGASIPFDEIAPLCSIQKVFSTFGIPQSTRRRDGPNQPWEHVPHEVDSRGRVPAAQWLDVDAEQELIFEDLRMQLDRQGRLVLATFGPLRADDQASKWSFRTALIQRTVRPGLMDQWDVLAQETDDEGREWRQLDKQTVIVLGPEGTLDAVHYCAGIDPSRTGRLAPKRFAPEPAPGPEVVVAPQPVTYTAKHRAPDGLFLDAENGSIVIQWEPDPETHYVLCAYEVWRCVEAGAGLPGAEGWTLLDRNLLKTTFVDTEIEPDRPYLYKVVSVARVDDDHPVFADPGARVVLEEARVESPACGPVSISRADWERAHPLETPAERAAAVALQEVDAETLERCLNTTYLVHEAEGCFAMFHVARTPDGKALDLTLDYWNTTTWTRFEERVLLDGTLEFFRRWRTTASDTVYMNQAKPSANAEVVSYRSAKVDLSGVNPRFLEPEAFSQVTDVPRSGCAGPLFTAFLLARLTAVDHSTEVYVGTPLFGTGKGELVEGHVLLLGDPVETHVAGRPALQVTEQLRCAREPGGRILSWTLGPLFALEVRSIELSAVSVDRFSAAFERRSVQGNAHYTPGTRPTPWERVYQPRHGSPTEVRGSIKDGTVRLLWEESLDSRLVDVRYQVLRRAREEPDAEPELVGETTDCRWTDPLPETGTYSYWIVSLATVKRSAIPPGLKVQLWDGAEPKTVGTRDAFTRNPHAAVHGPPVNLAYRATPEGIQLSWQPNPTNAGVQVSYKVFRRSASGGAWVSLGPASKGRLLDTGVGAGASYVYKVVSLATGGELSDVDRRQESKPLSATASGK